MNQATSTITDRTHTAGGPTATRLVDNTDAYAVELDLTPIAVSLLSDLLIAMKDLDPSLIASLIAAGSLKGIARHDRLRRVIERTTIHAPFKVYLAPEVAQSLAFELEEAAQTPPTCDCGSYFLDEESHRGICRACLSLTGARIGA